MAGDSARTPAATGARNATLGVLVALGLVYIIWGSTYLAIRFADETMPPLLMGGVRFLIAGGLLYTWQRLRGGPNPTWRQWKSAGIVGLCLLAGGNGMVIVVEQRVASSVTALLVALVPLWTVIILWLRRSGARPTLRTMAGVAIGLVGVGLLVTHGGGAGGGVNPMAFLLIISTGLWAWGSVYAQGAELPPSPLMSTAVEMLVGGAALMLLALVTGEPGQLAGHAVSFTSLKALGYLIVFGSIVAYTAYTWLLKNATPALVSTYAYVNPLVAVLLGWALLSESVTIWTLLSSAVIVCSIVLITLPKRHKNATVSQKSQTAPPAPSASEPTVAIDHAR